MGEHHASNGDGLIDGRPSPLVSRWFTRYAARMLRRQFASVRLTPGGREVLEDAARSEGPLILAMNHASWWDPIVGAALMGRFFADRPALTPMADTELRRFRFMRRLGMFGIDQTRRDALRRLTSYALDRFETEPRSVLCITPQGAFTDVRTPIRARPGAAAVAARAPGVRVLLVSCEYTFWQERRPEIFIRAVGAARPAAGSTGAWRRSIERDMEDNRTALAAAVIARDGSAFEPLLTGKGSHVHPVYDLLLRLRGRSARIDPQPGRAHEGSGPR